MKAIFNLCAAAMSWAVEVYKDVVYPILQPALGAAVTMVKCLLIFSVAIGNIFKFALDEASVGRYVSWFWSPNLLSRELNPSVSLLCYVVLYLIPFAGDVLMDHMDLPHYTPHILSNMALYVLSLRLSHVSSADAVVTPSRRGKASSTGSNSSPSSTSPASKTLHATATCIPESERRRLEQDLSQRILRSLRWAVPCSFLMDGFSSANASFAMAEAPARLIVAYFLSLTSKQGLILSPVAWVGWSVQVLLAAYLPSGYLLDIVLGIVGLSFIRLAYVLHRDQGTI